MEIALGGIIILIILLPGISFRKGYFSEEFSNQYTIRDFFQLFINTLFPSLISYILFLPIIYFLFGYYYDFKILLGILSSNEKLVELSIEAIAEFKFQILVFQTIINTASFYVGYKLKNLILKHSFDAKNKFFRYKNIWHYLLSAKFMLFQRSQIELRNNDIEDIDITFIDALLTFGEHSCIYTGILVDYELSTEGSLDLLYIKNAQRKFISDNNDSEYKDIDGHIIILKYEHIINLNLSFIQVIELEDNNIEFTLIG
jgi:hypothetical protein